MDIFELMYQAKDNSKKVSSFLEEYLLFEIYSPAVVRFAHQRWNELPYYVRDSVHPEMKELIQKANHFSTLELQEKIRAHLIVRAINVLLGYKNCPIPLTKDKHIPVVHQNILSNRGEWVLRRLLHAACHQEYTHDMAELALRASHKFLMNTDYYKKVNLDFEEVDQLVLKSSTKEKDENYYYFPILQLTQGCVNGCSHCFCNAKKPVSYMPYPLWRALYERLDNYYKHEEGLEWGITKKRFPFSKRKLQVHRYPYSFSRFFHDSDPSAYNDSIMGVDGGDIALFVASKGNDYYFLTKGITDDLSKRAIAKAAKVSRIELSFVDTPKENMKHNIDQMQRTKELVESVPLNKGMLIWHVHLMEEKSVSQEIFGKTPFTEHIIVPSGRANQFPKEKLNKGVDRSLYPFVIHPNGDVVYPECVKGNYQQIKLANLFQKIKD